MLTRVNFRDTIWQDSNALAFNYNPQRMRLLFQKCLQNSDVTSAGRIILPKREAEFHLPRLDSKSGLWFHLDDMDFLHVWTFKFRFWPNNNSRMYLLENTRNLIEGHDLGVGDSIMIYKDDYRGTYLVRARREIMRQITRPTPANAFRLHPRMPPFPDHSYDVVPPAFTHPFGIQHRQATDNNVSINNAVVNNVAVNNVAINNVAVNEGMTRVTSNNNPSDIYLQDVVQSPAAELMPMVPFVQDYHQPTDVNVSNTILNTTTSAYVTNFPALDHHNQTMSATSDDQQTMSSENANVGGMMDYVTTFPTWENPLPPTPLYSSDSGSSSYQYDYSIVDDDIFGAGILDSEQLLGEQVYGRPSPSSDFDPINFTMFDF